LLGLQAYAELAEITAIYGPRIKSSIIISMKRTILMLASEAEK